MRDKLHCSSFRKRNCIFWNYAGRGGKYFYRLRSFPTHGCNNVAKDIVFFNIPRHPLVFFSGDLSANER